MHFEKKYAGNVRSDYFLAKPHVLLVFLGFNHVPNGSNQIWIIYTSPFLTPLQLPVLFQVLKKISGYIQEQNEKIYAPRGLLLTDPIERGMRVVSFVHLLLFSKIKYSKGPDRKGRHIEEQGFSTFYN